MPTRPASSRPISGSPSRVREDPGSTAVCCALTHRRATAPDRLGLAYCILSSWHLANGASLPSLRRSGTHGSGSGKIHSLPVLRFGYGKMTWRINMGQLHRALQDAMPARQQMETAISCAPDEMTDRRPTIPMFYPRPATHCVFCRTLEPLLERGRKLSITSRRDCQETWIRCGGTQSQRQPVKFHAYRNVRP